MKLKYFFSTQFLGLIFIFNVFADTIAPPLSWFEIFPPRTKPCPPIPPMIHRTLTGDPVTTADGRFVYEKQDFSLKGTGGLSIGVKRTYRSQLEYHQSHMGRGWDLSLLKTIVVIKDSATCTSPQQVLGFFGDSNVEVMPIGVLSQAPATDVPNRNAKIRGLFSGAPQFSNLTGFEMRFRDGTLYRFNEYGDSHPFFLGCSDYYWISQIEDRNGKQIDFTYETEGGPVLAGKRLKKVAIPGGRDVRLNYNTAGVIEDASEYFQDTLLRTVSYTYDGDRNLTRVDFPSTEAGAIQISHKYAPGTSNMTEVVGPREMQGLGRADVLNIYNINGQVEKQTIGGESEYRYIYDLIHFESPNYPTDLGWIKTTGKVLAIGPDGGVKLTVFDENGRDVLSYEYNGRINPSTLSGSAYDEISELITLDLTSKVNALDPTKNFIKTTIPAYIAKYRSTDPNARITYREFDTHGMVTRVETPNSLVIRTFDHASPDSYQWQNVLKEELHPIPDNGEGVHTKTVLWDPIYNQKRAQYSYTGNLREYVYDYQEGDPASTLQGLISTWGIDLAQNSTLPPALPLPVNLGNVNGDTTTTQTHGNLILDRRPSPDVYTAATLIAGTRSSHVIETKYQYNGHAIANKRIDPLGNEVSFEFYPESTPHTGTPSATNSGYIAKMIMPEGAVASYEYDSHGRVSRQINAKGRATNYAYNADNRRTQIFNDYGDLLSTVYDAAGNIASQTRTHREPLFSIMNAMPVYSNGELQYSLLPDITTAYTYDRLNRLSTVEVPIDSLNTATIRHFYDRASRRVLSFFPEQENFPARLRARLFDDRGRPYKIYQGGVDSDFKNEYSNQLIEGLTRLVENPEEPAVRQIIQMEYTDRGHPKKVTDPDLYEWTRSYDGHGRLTRKTDPLGNYLEYTFDGESRVSSVGHFKSNGTLLKKVEFSYDAMNQLYEHNTTLTADTTGFPAGYTLSPGGLRANGKFTKRFAYDQKGRIIADASDYGVVSERFYDGLDRLIKEKELGGEVEVLFEYDLMGNLLKRTKKEKIPGAGTNDHIVYHFYDEFDRPTAMTDEWGRTTRRLYDSLNRIVYQSDSKNSNQNLPIADLDPEGDHGTLPGITVNDHGNRVRFNYDLAGRQTQINRAMLVGGSGEGALDLTQGGGDGFITKTMTYDLDGLKLMDSDDESNSTTYTYDDSGRLYNIEYPDSTDLEILEFDNRGNIKSYIDPRGVTFNQMFDSRGLRTQVNITKPASVGGYSYQNFAYDELGRLISASNDYTTVTRSYDSLDRLISETQGGQSIYWEFDRANFQQRIFYPGGRIIKRELDGLSRLGQIVDQSMPSTPVVKFEWSATRLLKRDHHLVSGQPATSTEYLYDPIGRLDQIRHDNSGGTLEHHDFDYDGAGNKKRREDLIRDIQFDYTYDSVNQMVSSDRKGSIQAQSIELLITYALDGVGNRSTVTGGPDAGTYLQSGNADILNLYSRTPMSTSHVYDLAANLKRQNWGAGGGGGGTNPTKIKYDSNGQMVQYIDPSNTKTQFRYDPFGRRIEKLTNVGAPSAASEFYYYQDNEVIEERNDQNTVMATYVLGLRTDSIVSMDRFNGSQWTTYYFLQDDLDNVLAITDSSGNAVETYAYGDYGRPLDGATYQPMDSGSALGNPYLFNGRRYDPETKMYYYRARYMDPRQGRFTSRDPGGTWFDSMNRGNPFTYAGNNPWSYRDPTGFETKVDVPPDPFANSRRNPGSKQWTCATPHYLGKAENLYRPLWGSLFSGIDPTQNPSEYITLNQEQDDKKESEPEVEPPSDHASSSEQQGDRQAQGSITVEVKENASGGGPSVSDTPQTTEPIFVTDSSPVEENINGPKSKSHPGDCQGSWECCNKQEYCEHHTGTYIVDMDLMINFASVASFFRFTAPLGSVSRSAAEKSRYALFRAATYAGFRSAATPRGLSGSETIAYHAITGSKGQHLKAILTEAITRTHDTAGRLCQIAKTGAVEDFYEEAFEMTMREMFRERGITSFSRLRGIFEGPAAQAKFMDVVHKGKPIVDDFFEYTSHGKWGHAMEYLVCVDALGTKATKEMFENISKKNWFTIFEEGLFENLRSRFRSVPGFH